MSIEIHTGMAKLRYLEGTFDDISEATDYVFKLMKEGHSPSFIYLYNTETGISISVKELFGGFI